MLLAPPEVVTFRLADHLEPLVWVPPLGTAVDLVECCLVLSASGQLPRPEPFEQGWALITATKSAAQRAVILARAHGYAVSWSERRSRGRRAYAIARFTMSRSDGDPLLGRLGQLQHEWWQGASGTTEPSVARSVWRAGLLAASHSSATDGSVVVRFPTSRQTNRAVAGAQALGVHATVLASRPEQRSRVQLSSSAIVTLVGLIRA